MQVVLRVGHVLSVPIPSVENLVFQQYLHQTRIHKDRSASPQHNAAVQGLHDSSVDLNGMSEEVECANRGMSTPTPSLV